MSQSDESTGGGVSINISNVVRPLASLLRFAISNGVLIPLMIGIILFTVIVKLPASDIANGIAWFGGNLQDWGLVGWTLFAVSLVSWLVHARWLDLRTKEENQYLGTKNSDLFEENREMAVELARLRERLGEDSDNSQERG